MKSQYEAILNESTILAEVEVKRPFLFFFKRSERVVLEIKGATADTMYRIVSMIEELAEPVDNSESDMYNMINSNTDLMISIIAQAIHNKPSSPPQWLLNSLRKLPWLTLKGYMSVAYRRLGIEDFFGCMGLIKSLNVQQSDTLEMTAPGE